MAGARSIVVPLGVGGVDAPRSVFETAPDGRRRLRKPDKGQFFALVALVIGAVTFVGNVDMGSEADRYIWPTLLIDPEGRPVRRTARRVGVQRGLGDAADRELGTGRVRGYDQGERTGRQQAGGGEAGCDVARRGPRVKACHREPLVIDRSGAVVRAAAVGAIRAGIRPTPPRSAPRRAR